MINSFKEALCKHYKVYLHRLRNNMENCKCETKNIIHNTFDTCIIYNERKLKETPNVIHATNNY